MTALNDVGPAPQPLARYAAGAGPALLSTPGLGARWRELVHSTMRTLGAWTRNFDGLTLPDASTGYTLDRR